MDYLPSPYRPPDPPSPAPPPSPPPAVNVVFSPRMTNKQEVGFAALVAAVLLGMVGGYAWRDRDRGPPR